MSDSIFSDNELFHLAIASARQQQHEATLRHLKELLMRNPKHADAQYLLGTAYATLGMMDEAANALELAVALAPEQVMAHFQLGLVQMGRGKPDLARSALAKMTAQSPEPALHEFSRGITAILDGDRQSAEQALRQGIEWNIANPSLNQDMQGLLDALDQMQLDIPNQQSSEAELPVDNAFLLGAYRNV